MTDAIAQAQTIAPATPGTYHVMATSKADPMQTAIATVTVSLAPVVSVSIDPAGVSVAPGAIATFTASVRGTPDLGVSWSVQQSGGGSVLDGVYTAPAAPGVYHVVAAAHADPTKTASAAVLVTAPGHLVSVQIDPAAATLRAGNTVRFNAIVTGAADASVTWTAPDGGTVDSAGLFLAPGGVGDYRASSSSPPPSPGSPTPASSGRSTGAPSTPTASTRPRRPTAGTW